MKEYNIRYYGYFLINKNSGKTPKFTAMEQVGYYPPMEQLIGRDGNISLYLMESVDGMDRPAARLQAKDSLNLTGLLGYYTIGGGLSGYAYGYPMRDEYYSKKKRPNPFFQYQEDCFLFKFYYGEGGTVPYAFEMVVFGGCRALAANLCEKLENGLIDDELESLRELARGTTLI